MSKKRRIYEAQLVGLASGRYYPTKSVVFRDRSEGERWCEVSNATVPLLTRWELIRR